jgi:phosphohistidine phosphatase SixA
MNSKKFKYIFFTVIFFALLIITSASIVYLYEKKVKIVNKLLGSVSYFSKDTYIEYSQDKYQLAKEILNNGGFILHFRHAEREKWIDVTMYDSIEINQKIRAEDEYYKDAVCLSKRGIIQAKMMGEIWSNLSIPVHQIISSPSCRARQTAELVFGEYNSLKSILLHKGAFREDFQDYRKKLKKLYLETKQKKGSNVIISSHNGVVDEKIFDKINNKPKEFFLEEGGFYVMKIENNKLIYIDKFHNFQDFNLQFRERADY